MARADDKQTSPPDIRVVIHDGQGKYLSGSANQWAFTEDRAAATVFYYTADHIPEQLEQLRQSQGLALSFQPVPMEEIYETCDRCKDLFMPYMIQFDGKQFLCADCRNRRAALKTASRLKR